MDKSGSRIVGLSVKIRCHNKHPGAGGVRVKITIEKNDLQKIITALSGTVSSKTTMPILANILVEAGSGEIRCAATDLEIGLDCRFPVMVEAEGGIALPARKLGEIVRELPNAPVYFDIENQVAKISCDRSHISLSGMSVDDFPPMPDFPEEPALELESSVLKNLLDKTRIAVSTEELRYALNGIYFHSVDNELRLVSTDGRRLSMMKLKVESGIKEKLGVIVPTKAIDQLSRILEAGPKVQIALKNNQIFFKVAEYILSSRLIDGQFPNYEQVIPAGREKKIALNTQRFLQSLRRVSVLASEKNNMVKLSLMNAKIIVASNTPELGDATDEFDVVYKGEDLQVAYNVKYVIDVLKNIETEETLLEFNQPLAPGVFRPADSQNYINVIMPMKIS